MKLFQFVLLRVKHLFEELVHLALSTTLAALAAALAAALVTALVTALALSAAPVSTPTFAASATIFTISTCFTRHLYNNPIFLLVTNLVKHFNIDII